MGFVVYVGNVRQGKSIKLTRSMLDARKAGRDCYANYLIGRRVRSVYLPVCDSEVCAALGFCTVAAPHMGPPALWQHDAPRFRLEEWTPELGRFARLFGWRVGRALVPDPAFTLLTEWEQLIALRVARDQIGAGHRLQLRELGEYVHAETGEVRHRWDAVPTCRIWDCRGCSKGITIGWDEIHGDMSARDWGELGGDMARRLSYSGKDGLDIYATAQDSANIDIMARRLFTKIVVCKKRRVLFFDLFTYAPYEAYVADDPRKAEMRENMPGRPGFFDYEIGLIDTEAAESFDTYERVRQFAKVKKGGRSGGLTEGQRVLIGTHLAGKHDKKAASTCPVCQVKMTLAAPVAVVPDEAEADAA